MKGERVKMTLLLDDETIKGLKQYSYDNIGSTNVSRAVMLMVKENGKQKIQSKENSRSSLQ